MLRGPGSRRARAWRKRLGVKLAFAEQLNVREPHPARLFGSGQLDALAKRFKEEGVTLFIVDGALTPVQQRNLETELKLKVVDRTGLILEIFGLRARTAEGRLQVEMARSLYERSRLVRTWTHLERQRGGFGFLGGPGEIAARNRQALARQAHRGLPARAGGCAPHAAAAARGPRAARRAGGGDRRLHQRGQVDAVQPADIVRRAGGGHAVRDARSHGARDRRRVGPADRAGRYGRASSPTCRRRWSPPSARRWKRRWRRTC